MSGLELRYFVLKPSGNGLHGYASREALLLYAKIMEVEQPDFAEEIRSWVKEETEKKRIEALASRIGNPFERSLEDNYD